MGNKPVTSLYQNDLSNEKWQKIQKKKKYKITEIKGIDGSIPKESDKIRIVCISDTHNFTDHENFPNIPDGDILIHAGDFTNHGKSEELEKFNDWLGTLPHEHKIVVAGNHDESLDENARNNTKESANEAKNMLGYDRMLGI